MKTVLLITALLLSSASVKAQNLNNQNEESVFYYGFLSGWAGALCAQVNQGRVSKAIAKRDTINFIELIVKEPEGEIHGEMLWDLFEKLGGDDGLCKGIFR